MNDNLSFRMRSVVSVMLFFSTFFFKNQVQSQTMTVTPATNSPGKTAVDLLKNQFFGQGIEVLQIEFSGQQESVGAFESGNTAVGLDKGIVLSTGLSDEVGKTGKDTASTDVNSTAVSTNLNSLAKPFSAIDVVRFRIRFVPSGDSIRFRYVFASEEYPEVACQPVTDEVGFFLFLNNQFLAWNIARIPGTNQTLGISSLHPQNPFDPDCPPSNEQFYRNNDGSGEQPVFDGLTTVLEATGAVEPCREYVLEIVLGEVLNPIYDSGLFLEAGSFSSTSGQPCATSPAGRFQIGQHIGQSNDVETPKIYLCFGDSLFLDHFGNAVFFDPEPATPPGIGWPIYTCLPTVAGETFAEIAADPCLENQPQAASGFWVVSDQFSGDIWLRNVGVLQNFFNSGQPYSCYFAPITVDDFFSTAFEPGGKTYVNTDAAIEVIYLNEVHVSDVQINDGQGSCSIRGGLPEYQATARYTATLTATWDPTISGIILSQSSQALGAMLSFAVPEPGTYLLTVEDGKSCGTEPLLLTFNMNPNPPTAPCLSPNILAADFWADACVFCEGLDGITGNTSFYTGQTPPGFCGSIENELWYAFRAGADTATFTATPSNCANGDGIQLALFQDFGFSTIDCDFGYSGGGDSTVSVSASLIPGHVYYLMIDGFAGDQCHFTVEVDPSAATVAPPATVPAAIQGASFFCSGASVVYAVDPVLTAGTYTWEAPPGALINGNPSPFATTETQVTITFGASGGQVCVSGSGSCSVSLQQCKTVKDSTMTLTALPPVVVCREDQPYILPWGDTASVSGVYEAHFQTAGGCDSVVNQQVTILPPVSVTLPPITICSGASIEVCGQTIDQSGSFSVVCQSWLGCDSTVSGLLVVQDLSATATVSNELTCSNPLATLQASTNQPNVIYFWTGPGNFISDLPNPQVSFPGTYNLLVFSAKGCSSTASATVFENKNPPAPLLVQSTDDTGSQGIGSIEISVSGGTPPFAFEWLKDDIFFSDKEDLAGLFSGTYTCKVTGSDSCEATLTVVLKNLVAADEPGFGGVWRLFPNPTDGKVNVSWQGEGAAPAVSFVIFDAAGRFLRRISGTGLARQVLDCSDFPAGVYKLEISSENGARSGWLRFAVVR